MSDLLMLAVDLTGGLLLGAIFYGGLWWTVRRFAARAAGLLLVLSFLVRANIVLAGFYAVVRTSWYGAAACFAGFLIARIAVTRFTRGRPVAGLSDQAVQSAGRLR
jgi:F1F0 ATPase subunit 2